MIERGQIWAAGEKGGLASKPRPVLVVQRTSRVETRMVTICLMSTVLTAEAWFRLVIDPSPDNGLQERTEIQVDRLFSLQRTRLDRHLGNLDAGAMRRVDQALRDWLDI